MKTITDKKQIDRLNEKNIVLEEIYLDRGKKLKRRSDGSILDQINFAPLIEKGITVIINAYIKKKTLIKIHIIHSIHIIKIIK